MDYNAPLTVSAFILCETPIHLIMGPFGSGKSTGCVMKILRLAQMQTPGADGKRRIKCAAVRNTYPELRDTTKKTFEEWVPAAIREWNDTEYKYVVRFNDVICEVLFRALDRPEDVKKLLSLELSCAWVNEAREIPKAIIDGLDGRVGRYPSKKDDVGCTNPCVFMDTNPPDDDHWIYKTFEEDCVSDPAIGKKYVMFKQPSGLSPDAENIRNLSACWDRWVEVESRKGLDRNSLKEVQWAKIANNQHEELCQCYYPKLAVGKTRDFIDAYVHGKYAFIKDGRPVYPEYRDEIHTLKEPPRYLGGPLYLGMDFGLTPAVVVAQKTATHQWQALREFVSDDMGATKFSQLIVTDLKRLYPEAPSFHGWGDPAGSARSQTDESTPFDVVQAAGLPIDPAHSNDFIKRREAVANALSRLVMTGQPALVISPECKLLRKAMAGGYMFKRVQISGSDRFRDAPEKNHFSHIAEALQYLMLGEGEDSSALNSRDQTNSSSRYKSVPSLPNRRARR
jgi:hypothetical protein